MLRGTHHDAQRNLKSGDLAPIDKKHYQKERWEVVGDGDLFVRCFRPQVIRLVREHLKAYREALPDRDAFCNALDEIRQHLLTEHFGVRYFSQDLQSVLDEWEESAWKVCPVKAGMFSGRQSHRGKSQSPVAWVASVWRKRSR